MVKKLMYLLDSNVFITAKKSYYGFDICPGFWRFLREQNSKGRIFSIDFLKKELLDRVTGDELSEWVNQIQSKELFLPEHSADVTVAYSNIMDWIQLNSQYRVGAKRAFSRGADCWLVAYGQARNGVIVTNETPAPNSLTRIKIPDVCKTFGVRWKTPFQMLRELGAKFQ